MLWNWGYIVSCVDSFSQSFMFLFGQKSYVQLLACMEIWMLLWLRLETLRGKLLSLLYFGLCTFPQVVLSSPETHCFAEAVCMQSENTPKTCAMSVIQNRTECLPQCLGEWEISKCLEQIERLAKKFGLFVQSTLNLQVDIGNECRLTAASCRDRSTWMHFAAFTDT